MALKCGINGFGRIGRLVFRVAFEDPEIEVVAINDLVDAHYAAYLLKYDSVHGTFPYEVKALDAHRLKVGEREIWVQQEQEPKNLRWADFGVETVVESTGLMLTQELAKGHLKAGAKKVVLSAPAKDSTPTYVMGVNHESYHGEPVVSNASCTTNCLAPLAKVLDAEWGIEQGLMSTIHATTATQKTVDGPSVRDWRGGRCASQNIIPATTGAAKAVGLVLPQLQGKLTGMSFRVPVPDVSVVDFTFCTRKETDYRTLCATLQTASETTMQGIIRYVDEPVVSMDLRGQPYTCIFDAQAGLSIGRRFFKCVAWYDNEIGYSTKTVDLAKWISRQ